MSLVCSAFYEAASLTHLYDSSVKPLIRTAERLRNEVELLCQLKWTNAGTFAFEEPA